MAPWRLLRISALAAGTLMLLFLLWMLIGHLTGDANGPNGMRFNGTKEVIAFTFFPCITVVGLALAYWRPLLGGGIAAGSIVALFTLRPDLLASPFIVAPVPGLLVVAHGWQSRRSICSTETPPHGSHSSTSPALWFIVERMIS